MNIRQEFHSGNHKWYAVATDENQVCLTDGWSTNWTSHYTHRGNGKPSRDTIGYDFTPPQYAEKLAVKAWQWLRAN